MNSLWLCLVLSCALTGSCRSEFYGDGPWLITRLQIIGWRATPPEGAPGSTVTLEVFALDPVGVPPVTATTWELCHTRKPLDENRVVAGPCLTAPLTDATGSPTQVAIPADACRSFGPEAPSPVAGDPPIRPRDPDVTGGYYQPLMIRLGTSLAIGLERLACDLSEASLDVARAFRATYQPNRNPQQAGLRFTVEGRPVDPQTIIAPNTRVIVEATWLADSAETFPVFDRLSHSLVQRQEILSGSWFVTGGALSKAGGQITDPSVQSLATTWQAPSEAGAFEIAFVLRDTRGGSDVAHAILTVGADR